MPARSMLEDTGLEDRITPDLPIAFVGPYTPTRFGFNIHRTGVRPEELLDPTFPIMPTDRPQAPGRPKRKKKSTAK